VLRIRIFPDLDLSPDPVFLDPVFIPGVRFLPIKKIFNSFLISVVVPDPVFPDPVLIPGVRFTE
jgi:hypothetical protein